MSANQTVRSGSAGHTLIEVMTAVALLTVGASGILAMQGATTRANQQAYESTVALGFAQTWIDRLKRDSLRWTAATEASRTAGGGPLYLSGVLSTAAVTNWLVPPADPVNPNETWAADNFGFDVVDPVANAAQIRFCVNYRLVQHSLAIVADPLSTNSVRAEVRVWWHQMGADRRVGGMQPGGCVAVPPAAVIALPGTREVYLSNVYRWEDPAP